MKINTYPNAWDLKYFQEVAQVKSFSRAAERLGVGQPALSLAMQRLEKALDSKLFFRRKGGLQLTSGGSQLLQQTDHLLKTWENIVTHAQRSESERKGIFRIGCHVSVGGYSLPKVLARIYNQAPGIQFQMEHGLSRVMVEQVISGDLDFAVAVNPIRHPDLVIVSMAKDEVCFWKIESAPLDILICDPYLIQSQYLMKKLGKKRAISKTLHSTSLELVRAFALEGLGTAILPTRVAKQGGDELKRCKDFPTYIDEICFVYRKDLYRSAASEYVIGEFRKARF